MKPFALAAAALLVVLGAGCGGAERSAGDGGSLENVLTVQEALDVGSGTLAVRGTVITSIDDVRLCSAILESYPPQCGSPSLLVLGLDLDTLDGLQHGEGVTWSDREVTVLGELEDGVLTAGCRAAT